MILFREIKARKNIFGLCPWNSEKYRQVYAPKVRNYFEAAIFSSTARRISSFAISSCSRKAATRTSLRDSKSLISPPAAEAPAPADEEPRPAARPAARPAPPALELLASAPRPPAAAPAARPLPPAGAARPLPRPPSSCSSGWCSGSFSFSSTTAAAAGAGSGSGAAAAAGAAAAESNRAV